MHTRTWPSREVSTRMVVTSSRANTTGASTMYLYIGIRILYLGVMGVSEATVTHVCSHHYVPRIAIQPIVLHAKIMKLPRLTTAIVRNPETEARAA